MAEKTKKKKKYYSANRDRLQKKMDSLDTGRFFKPKEGKNTVRILPPWSKEGLWYKEATLHYGLNNEEGKSRGYPCLKQFGEDCPICEVVSKLAGGDELHQRLSDVYHTDVRRARAAAMSMIPTKTGAAAAVGRESSTARPAATSARGGHGCRRRRAGGDGDRPRAGRA